MRFKLPFKGLAPPPGVLNPQSAERRRQASSKSRLIAQRLSQDSLVIELWKSNDRSSLLKICEEEWRLLDFYTLVSSQSIFNDLQTILKYRYKKI